MSPVGHLLYLFTQQNELLMSVALNIGLESDEGSNSNTVCPEGEKVLHLNNVARISAYTRCLCSRGRRQLQ